MAQRIRLKGGAQLDAALRLLPERLAARVTGNALAGGARLIRDEAKARAPVESGALRDSIVVRRARGRAGQVFVGFLKPVSRRAHLTEFGTSKASAKPFMRPAFETKVGAALLKIGQMLNKGLAREAAKLAGRPR